MSSDKDDKHVERDALEAFIQEIGKYEPLPHEEELELARRIQQGDQEALEKLVKANLRFVVMMAKKYSNPNVPLMDLISEGTLGLIQAAKKYNPFEEGKNVKFITYAVWWVRQAMLQLLASHVASFRLPQKQANLLYKLMRARTELQEALGRQPTDEELANHLGIPVEEVALLTQTGQRLVSLDQPIDEDGEAHLGDLVGQGEAEDVEEAVVWRSLQETLKEALDELPERERRILELRFGLEDGTSRTLREVGEELGLSRERVRQLELRALSRLRRSAKGRALASFLN